MYAFHTGQIFGCVIHSQQQLSNSVGILAHWLIALTIQQSIVVTPTISQCFGNAGQQYVTIHAFVFAAGQATL